EEQTIKKGLGEAHRRHPRMAARFRTRGLYRPRRQQGAEAVRSFGREEVAVRLSWLNIPAEMRALKQWAVATLALDADGVPDKSPRHPRTGNRISSVDPLTWSSFEECVNAGYPAIGFLLAPSDPF